MSDLAVEPAVEQSEVQPVAKWPLATRIAFRFFFSYWVLYCLPERGRISVLYSIPYLGQWLAKPYIDLWHAIVPWVAMRWFHVTGRPATYVPTGSGDTTLQYVQTLLFVLTALAATLLWSILDRKRPNYRTLHEWLRVLLRFTLAFTLFSYGFAKIFPLQFQPPPLSKLIQPYGDSSPMGVLWSFMGSSLPYTMFSGSAEVLGGLLLLFRRTATLGAMVSFAVMVNVAALNYCYDVPVKLYSTHLALMAAFLLAPELGRLADVFVFNRPAPPSSFARPLFERRELRIGATVCWALIVGYLLFNQIAGGWAGYQRTYISPKRPPLYGLYDVESGPDGWHKVFVAFPQSLGVRTVDDQVRYFGTDYSGDHAVTLNKRDHLTWKEPDKDHVELDGTINGSKQTIVLKRIDPNKFLLLNRGYHWINEMPFNR